MHINLKTGLTALAIATSPLQASAQKTSTKLVKPTIVEHVLNDTIGAEASNLISYKEFDYGANYIGSATIKALKSKGWAKPANFRKPKPEMANAEVVNADNTKFVYDKFGNVKSIISKQGHKTRSIVRDPDGNLCQYSNIRYKDGKKSLEEVFDDRGFLVEKREFHGNERATITTFDDQGNKQFEGLFKTEMFEGEEIVPGGCECYFE